MSSRTVQPRIVITRAIFPEIHQQLAERFEVHANQADDVWSRDELVSAARECDGAFVVPSDRVDAALLDAVPSLRIVSTGSVGYNHIDVLECTRRGIVVTHTPDVLTETTADFGFALLLATARRVTESEHWLRAGHWKRWAFDQLLGIDIHGSTLGIVGMGRIGQAIARRAAGFGMRVLYHNRHPLEPETLANARVSAEWRSKDVLLAEADHVILVVPYSADTHHCIGARELALMRPTATLVNLARGGVVDDAALVQALRARRLFAAGLDVYENEPALHPGLLDLDNVVLTPHIASASGATRRGMAGMAANNLLAFFSGARPPNVVNPDVLDRTEP